MMTTTEMTPFVPTPRGISPGLRSLRPPPDGTGVKIIDRELERFQALSDRRTKASRRKDAAEKALKAAPEMDESALVAAVKNDRPDPGKVHELAARAELDAANREVDAVQRAIREHQQDTIVCAYNHRREVEAHHEKTIAKARQDALRATSALIGALEVLADELSVVRWVQDPRQPFRALGPTIPIGNGESVDAIASLRSLALTVSGEPVDRI